MATTDAPAGLDVARGSGTPVVDCLLPAQLRKLGPAMPYLAPQRAIRTSVEDCAIRGGKAFRLATATAPESASRVASVQVPRSVDPPPRRRAEPRGEALTGVPGPSDR
jgi:hypothetical protein